MKSMIGFLFERGKGKIIKKYRKFLHHLLKTLTKKVRMFSLFVKLEKNGKCSNSNEVSVFKETSVLSRY